MEGNHALAAYLSLHVPSIVLHLHSDRQANRVQLAVSNPRVNLLENFQLSFLQTLSQFSLPTTEGKKASVPEKKWIPEKGVICRLLLQAVVANTEIAFKTILSESVTLKVDGVDLRMERKNGDTPQVLQHPSLPPSVEYPASGGSTTIMVHAVS